MIRIYDPTAVAAEPAVPTLTGIEGFFTEGNPATGVPATLVRGWWLNLTQESLIAILTAGGIAQSATDNSKLLQAISLIGRRGVYYGATSAFVVPALVFQVKIRMVGGGGGGGAGLAAYGGGGGGAGGYAEAIIPVTPGQTIPINIGAGGTAGISGGAAPGAGGTTSFGSYLATTGGSGGSNAANFAPGGLGGSGTAGTGINAAIIQGGSGSDGNVNGSGTFFPGNGGASAFGGGGRAATGSGASYQAGQAWGAGGGAGYAFASNGGAGAAGVLLLEY